MEQYSIYAGHMDDLMQKVTKIQNKCKKFGCDFHFAQVGEEIKEVEDPTTINPLTGKPVVVRCKFIIVEAEGTAIINGWEFVASVEHTPAGNIFSKAMSDVEIPEAYRTMNPICEHCNSRRTRKSTFIIRNTETGEFKMVGKSCLMDFTNGLSASTAVWFASLKQVFQEAVDLPIGSCGYSERYYSTREVLQYTAETIRHFGYSKSENHGDSTKDRMFRFMLVDMGQTRWMHEDLITETKTLMEQVKFNAKSEQATEMVDNALNWILNQEATNDYLHNLKTACSLADCHSGRFGILASLFPTFNRELEVQAKREEKQKAESKSEHQGQVGSKLIIEVESVKCITSWESTYGYYPTVTYVWKIIDKQGNVYTWKTSNWMDEQNPPKTIKGTVKEHKVFREVKQTELTRCRVA